MNQKVNVYNAGRIFSEGDRKYRLWQGEQLRQALGDTIDLYNPIEAPFNEDKDAAVPTPEEIYKGDFDRLQTTDILLFDYSELEDPGVSCEIGIMAQRIADHSGLDRPPVIIGILSDSRRGTANSYPNEELPPLGCNHMILGLNKIGENKVVYSFNKAVAAIQYEVALRRALKRG